MPELLFEIGTEELPAGFQQPALDQLRENFVMEAETLNLPYTSVTTLGTPRRLTLLVQGLAGKQPDSREDIMGPSRQAGFDEAGNPSKAAMGFARSKGCEVSDLQVVKTEKGEYLMLVKEIKGQSTQDIVPDLLTRLIRSFSFAKSMRWGEGSFTFARPLQWILAIFDGRVVDFSHEGMDAADTTRGHRFMADREFKVTGISNYLEVLGSGFVQVDPEKRREEVLAEVNRAVSDTLGNGSVKAAVDENLLETVCNLVEKPFGICGTFDQKFLQLPDEALVTSMREHQKYFPVVDEEGRLMPNFVAVNNTKVKDSSLTRKGHERVLRARLEDAYFFFESDKKIRLNDRVEGLGGIIFQARLGTMLEKTDRIEKLAAYLASLWIPDDVNDVCRAARLCKADLLTDMVGEFPSLQGNMGCAYGIHDGEKDVVALAIQEHYLPKRAGSALPVSPVGAVVGLADRFDTLCGCFGIGQIPSGTKDPFGLRRIAIAILHIVEQFKWQLSISDIVAKALSLYGDKVNGGSETCENIRLFIRDRFINDQIASGVDSDAVEAVTSVIFDDSNDCIHKISALNKMRRDESFAVLAASFKRIRNIIKDNDKTDIETALFKNDAEISLYEACDEVERAVKPMLESHNYEGALTAMLDLKDPVDVFFEKVMVMDDDPAVRVNRLNLLTSVSQMFLRVGDISKMQ